MKRLTAAQREALAAALWPSDPDAQESWVAQNTLSALDCLIAEWLAESKADVLHRSAAAIVDVTRERERGKAEAWDEGYAAGYAFGYEYAQDTYDGPAEDPAPNPYRASMRHDQV